MGYELPLRLRRGGDGATNYRLVLAKQATGGGEMLIVRLDPRGGWRAEFQVEDLLALKDLAVHMRWSIGYVEFVRLEDAFQINIGVNSVERSSLLASIKDVECAIDYISPGVPSDSQPPAEAIPEKADDAADAAA